MTPLACRAFALMAAALLASAQAAPIITEYIGADPGGLSISPDQLTSFGTHISTGANYNLILGFARDNGGDGSFTAFWDTNTFTAANIASFKSQFTNVKFLMSVGGDGETWTDSSATSGDCSSWISTATSSVNGLISQYGLDGLDLDYESFSGSDNFVTCISGLISNIKGSGGLISIAPFGATESLYASLYAQAGDNIDFVGYQAYADEEGDTAVTGVDGAYTTLFQNLQSTYPASKLLMGIDTNVNSPRGQQFSNEDGGDVTQTLQSLYQAGLVNGAMLFDAEDSQNADFVIEGAVENVLGVNGRSRKLLRA